MMNKLLIDGFSDGDFSLESPPYEYLHQTSIDTLSTNRTTEFLVNNCFGSIEMCGTVEVSSGIFDLALKQTAEGNLMGKLFYEFPFMIDIFDWDYIELFSPVGFDLEAIEKLDLTFTASNSFTGYSVIIDPEISIDTILFDLSFVTEPQINMMEFLLKNKPNSDAKGIDATIDQISLVNESPKTINEGSNLLSLGFFGLCLAIAIVLKKKGK